MRTFEVVLNANFLIKCPFVYGGQECKVIFWIQNIPYQSMCFNTWYPDAGAFEQNVLPLGWEAWLIEVVKSQAHFQFHSKVLLSGLPSNISSPPQCTEILWNREPKYILPTCFCEVCLITAMEAITSTHSQSRFIYFVFYFHSLIFVFIILSAYIYNYLSIMFSSCILIIYLMLT